MKLMFITKCCAVAVMFLHQTVIIFTARDAGRLRDLSRVRKESKR